MNNTQHIPVMLTEAIHYLAVKPHEWYVDCTFGRGGHTREILKAGGQVIAFDVDQEAIEYGQTEFATEIKAGQLILIRDNFEHLETAIERLQQDKPNLEISGILFDFGTSTNQLMSEARGFSFNSEALLDMRMDQRLGVTANDLLNVIPENQLAELFAIEGGEHEAKTIAKVIKRHQARAQGHMIWTAKELADLITNTKHEHGKLHAATKVFQALRIAVNQELDSIQTAVPQALHILKPQGRLVTIAFHEGEDRIVKQLFTKWEQQHKGVKILKHSSEPSETELATNPRARSAKLRVFEKS